MNNCLNCGKEVKQTPGKKERKYCDDKCKQKHWQKMKAEKKGNVTISREEYNELMTIKSFKLNEVSITKNGPAIGIIDIEYSKTDPKLPGLTRGFKTIKVKPEIKDLNKESLGEKPYNPKDNPAHQTDIEIVVGGRNTEKTSKKSSYFEKRQQLKLKK